MPFSTRIAIALMGTAVIGSGSVIAIGSADTDQQTAGHVPLDTANLVSLWRNATGPLPDGSQGRAGGVRVIEIHQTTCQLLQAEHYIDQNFTATSAEQCQQINARTWPERAANARPLTAMHGDFKIRVTNLDVPYPIDFWLRPYQNHFTAAQPAIALPEYRIDAIAPGETREIQVNLPRSFYIYSSPGNGTPDYSLLIYDPDPRFHW